MNERVDTTVLYSAVLRPHRSAGIRGARMVTGILTVVVAASGTGFALAGAWPILPFFGAELLLLYGALRLNQRAGNAEEAINLTRRALTVRRTDHWGKQSCVSFPPHWLQVNLLPLPGDDNRLELRSHGHSLAIASFLTPDEREALALTLRRALGRLVPPPAEVASSATSA
ncbi:MAG: DUF2244 domain-containing protein [Rhodospirillales bacterium]|nr:DUF2244 domain-containing protein [Rhodospirillales bacterium]